MLRSLMSNRNNRVIRKDDRANCTMSLLTKRAFLPLFLTQFFGAFNDNAFKLAMLTLVSYYLSVSASQSESYQAIASALFILPFFLFSATAGQLADSYDKARVVRFIKFFEILLMSIGGLAIYYGNCYLMFTTLTGLGIHSTFFGPIKYAILPEQLPRLQLLGATALIEASTFAAILLGTTLGTISISGIKSGSIPAIILIGIAALAGFMASWFIPSFAPTSTVKIDWNIWRATCHILKQVIHQRQIMIVICGISWFWLLGTVVLTKLPDYTNFVLHAESSVFALFLALFSLGIASGSLAVNRLFSGKVNLHYVPHAMLLLSLFAADIFLATPSYTQEASLYSISDFFYNATHIRIAFDLFMLAFSGGLFVVPMYTYLQISSDDTLRARTIAANNIFNSLFMVLGSLWVMLLLYWKVIIPEVFLIMAMINALVALSIWYLFRRRR
jgi:MFS family permease